MKKVLYITTVSRTINSFLVPHIKMLIRNGYKVECATFIDKDIDESLLKDGVKVYNIPFSRNPLNLSNLKAFRELIKLQKENNYDIVHVHTPVASLYGRLLKLIFKNIKTIYTAHGYHFLKGGSKLGWIIYYPIEKVMAKLTDITININKEDYEITKNKLKPKMSYLINGVGLDLNVYKILDEVQKNGKRKELDLEDNDFVVLIIAELNENKNHIQLIRAMELLKSKYKNIKVLCAGEGSKRDELQNEINNRGLSENIKLLGQRKDINELINISNIGVLLSYREGLPRNIMEFMANEKKVIATNIRGNRDLICNSDIGKLVEVGDFVSLAEEIENYLLKNDNSYISKEILKYDIKKVEIELYKIYELLESDYQSNYEGNLI